MNDLIDTLLTAVRDMDPVARTLIAMVGMFLETSVLIGLVIPGDSIALLASAGVANSTQYFALLFALVLGAIAGESVGFMLGRYFGPRLRSSRLGRRIGERNWMLADLYLGDRGGVAVFVSRFLPILHSLVPLSAGMTRMRFRTFLTWTIPACVLWAVIYVSIGVFAAVSYERIAGTVKGAGYILVAFIAIFVLGIWLFKRWLMRSELAKHESEMNRQEERSQTLTNEDDSSH